MNNKISPPPKFLIDRYKKWKSSEYIKNEGKLRNLASFGQSPSTMVISCCDSRIHATSIFGADEGEFFIHRNIANIVPPFSPDGEYHGTSAAIEYATMVIKVSHLIILGHRDCGGIKSFYNSRNNKNSDYFFINKWLNILSPILSKISNDISPSNQIELLEEENIKNSINNLFSFPNIKNAVENNNLSIHGLIHDIGTGKLKYLNPSTEKFELL